MIETPYAFKKFINAVRNIKDTDYYFLCETQTAYSNLDAILSTAEASELRGIIVGRSDFAKSYDLDKSHVNNEFLTKKVRDIFVKAKRAGLKTTMGGNISIDSTQFIAELYSAKLLDKIETRNMVVELNDKNVATLVKTIKSVLTYEIEWLKFKADNYTNIGGLYLNRAKTLEERIR